MIAALVLVLAAAAAPNATPAASHPARASVEGPVAVMPFRNLNGDAAIDWMKTGIAETMLTDLKKSGKVRVVERDQVDHALTEVTLQVSRAETEESTAARVGKLVGAKTIVVGSFQKAAKELRINARFVSVETGEVLDSAKTTGPAADPFALQDRIVAQLLGVPAASPALPKRKPATAKTVEAYRLYAMALTTASDADRAGYLKQSLAVDPDFVYSVDAMEALRKRMGLYQDVSKKALTADQEALYQKAHDEKVPARDRAVAAGKLEDSLLNSRRFHTLVKVSGEVYDAHFPAVEDKPDPSLYAAYCRVYALHQLKEWDLALQYGEAFLKQFPGGWGYDNVDRTMKSIIDAREGWKKAEAKYDTELAQAREQVTRGKPVTPENQAAWDYASCLAAMRIALYPRMAEECSAVARKYENGPTDAQRRLAQEAMWDAFTADGVVGKFDEGREWAKKLADHPQYGKDVELIVNSTWPTD